MHTFYHSITLEQFKTKPCKILFQHANKDIWLALQYNKQYTNVGKMDFYWMSDKVTKMLRFYDSFPGKHQHYENETEALDLSTRCIAIHMEIQNKCQLPLKYKVKACGDENPSYEGAVPLCMKRELLKMSRMRNITKQS